MSSTKENQNWTDQVCNALGSNATAKSGHLASLGNRFLACLIDGALVGVAASLITAPFLMSGIVPWILGPFLTAAVAFSVFTVANYGLLDKEGQTIGKKIMNLRIVSSDGTHPDVKELLLKRYAVLGMVAAIPYIGILLAIGNMLMALRESRLAMHDEIAHTKVVNV